MQVAEPAAATAAPAADAVVAAEQASAAASQSKEDEIEALLVGTGWLRIAALVGTGMAAGCWWCGGSVIAHA